MKNRKRPASWPKSGCYWLLHHEGPLIEYTPNIDERWDYIITNKPEGEIDRRLDEIAPVKGKLPKEVEIACAMLDIARVKRETACAMLDINRVKRDIVRAKRDQDIVRAKRDQDIVRAKRDQDIVRAEWETACAKLDIACAEWDTAYAKYLPELEILHRQECPDSKWNGKTIFPKGGK